MRSALTALLLPCLLALSPTPALALSPDPTLSQDLELRVEPAAGGEQFDFGAITDTRFTIRNTSDTALVVLRVTPRSTAFQRAKMLTSRAYGAITKDVENDRYAYNEIVQQETQMPMHQGLVLPGQTLSFVTPFRALAPETLFEVAYWKADQAYDGSVKSMLPFRVYIPNPEPEEGERGVFVPFTEDGWKTLLEASAKDPGMAGQPPAVLVEAGNAAEVILGVKPGLNFSGTLFPPGVAMQAATKKWGSRPAGAEMGYCSFLGGYVARGTGVAALLIKPPSANPVVNEGPNVPPDFLCDIDRLDSVLIRVSDQQDDKTGPERRMTGKMFQGTYPTFFGDGMYTRGTFFELKKSQYRLFLEECKTKGWVLAVENYYIDKHYFVLTQSGGK